MPDEREGVHVRRIVVLVAARHWVAIATVKNDPTLDVAGQLIGWRDQAAALDFGEPHAGVFGEALGSLLAPALQRQVHVVVVDKDRAQDLP